MTNYVEDLLEVKQWRSGYEFKIQSRWLEVMSFIVQAEAVNVIVIAYDPIENNTRRFSMETGHVHRTRRSREAALMEQAHPLERLREDAA